MHCSSQKTNWGAKGAPRGASTKIPSPIWVPFGDHFSYLFVFLMQRSVYLTHVVFFSQFLGCTECSWGWAHMQSVHVYAVQTHFSVVAFFLKKGSLGSSTRVHFGIMCCYKFAFCVKRYASKNASRKVPRQSQTTPYPQVRRPPERQPRVRTVQTRNSCSSSS